MPEFGSPFAGLSHDKKLSHDELVRALRFLIASEYEAIQLYVQIAEVSNNPLADAVLRDIANEEKVHAGELLRLLREIEPQEAEFYAAGAKEVEEEMEEMGGSKPAENQPPPQEVHKEVQEAVESSEKTEKVAAQAQEKQAEASVETPHSKAPAKAKKPASANAKTTQAPAQVKTAPKAKPAAEKKPAKSKNKPNAAESADN